MSLVRNTRWLGWEDYIVFSGFMSLSIGVGVYFSIWGNRKRSTNEYLTADRQMSPFPSAISIAVSFISSVTMLGLPAETYVHGYMFTFTIIGQMLVYIPVFLLFAKLFRPLDISSPNEYLHRRFKSKVVAGFGYGLSTLSTCFYNGMCMYGPAIALNQASGSSLPTPVTFIIGNAIGVIYTSIGGFKAVIWTDVVQALFMLVALFTTCIHALVGTGGVDAAVKYNIMYSRLHPVETSLDPRIRHSVIGLIPNGALNWATLAVTPAVVQRFAAMSNLKTVRTSLFIAAPVVLCFSVLAVSTGLGIFGFYSSRGCDVVSAGWLSSANAIVTYYVTDQIRFPGFPGLMIAAVYASSLSTLSSGLSALGNITWRDLLAPYWCMNMSDRKAAFMMKGIVAGFGVVATALGYAAMKGESLLIQTLVSLDGTLRGPLLSIFILAGMARWVNAYGAISGLMGGFGIGMGLNILSFMSDKPVEQLPTVVSNCSFVNLTMKAHSQISVNVTMDTTGASATNSANDFLLSYVWILTISFFSSLIIGALVSLLTCHWSPPVEEKYLWSFCRRKPVTHSVHEELEGKEETVEFL